MIRSVTRVALGLWVAMLVASTLGLHAGSRERATSPFSALPLTVPSPADNPSTPEKVALGRMLFWDPILSGGQDIACATCHHPDHGYADGRALPIGAGGKGIGPARAFPGGLTPLVKRNSPTILNVAFNGIDVDGHVDPEQAPMFWDSRARGLEAQALIPVESLEEMRGGRVADRGGVAAAVDRISRVHEYQVLFARAFGGSGAEAVTATNTARAIAAFERSLVTPDTPFDRYMRGDQAAMTPSEVRGMQAFEQDGCTQCHKGPMLSDYALHVLGVSDNPALGAADPGADHQFAFRTAALRNLGYTAPYMHSGLLADLMSTVGFYKIVGGGGGLLQHFDTPLTINGHLVLGSPVSRDRLDPLLRQVSVNSRLDDVVDFLRALDGDFDRTIPSKVPSGLKPGGK